MTNLTGLSIGELLSKRKRLHRELSQQPGLQNVWIAVLGGSTTNELVYLLELLLLDSGFLPTSSNRNTAATMRTRSSIRRR